TLNMPHLPLKTRGSIQGARSWFFVLLIFGSLVDESAALDLVGYLPYYYLYDAADPYIATVLPTQLGMLNEVRYFGLTVGSDGSILPHDETLQFHKDKIALIKQLIN